jgi:hypothetical protein
MRHRSATLLPSLLLVVPLALPPRAHAAPARDRVTRPAASAALAAPSFLFRLFSNLGLGDWGPGGDGRHDGPGGPPHDPPPHDPPEGSGLCPHG